MVGLIGLTALLLTHTGWTISIFEFVLSLTGSTPILNPTYPKFDLAVSLLGLALATVLCGLLNILVLSPLLLAERRYEAKTQAEIEKKVQLQPVD